MGRKRIGVGNHKGGSGKSNTVRNIAAAAAERGKRVLVGDLDPQANLSRRMAAKFDPDNPTPTMAEVIKDGSPGVAVSAIRPCGWPEPYRSLISVIPSRFDLENRISEAGVVGAVLRLQSAMDGADEEFDLVLFDFPPSLGHLTQLGLAAVDWALCSMDPEYDGIDGAIRFRDFVQTDRNRKALGNPGLDMLGFVVNRMRGGMGAHAFQLDGLGELFGDRVWSPYIPERAAEKDASDGALPLRLVPTTAAREQAKLWDGITGRVLTAVAA